MRIGAQRRQHTPIGDVIHRIRHSPQQIKQAVKADEAPSARSNREQAHNNHRVADASDQNPRFEFSHFKMRIFDDENGKMNLALQQVGGAILSISQFTLFANCKKGNRPSFDGAGKPEHAKAMYLYFNEVLRRYGLQVEEGIFAADMKVELLNDGPITICLDSEDLK